MAEIIAIDDEREWRELYSLKLSEFGHTVRTFADGRDALKATPPAEPPDLVVLDIRMAPSGRDMLRKIRRAWPELPVVVASAYGGYRADPDFAEASAFVDKSADLSHLAEAVEQLLQGRSRA